MKPPIRKISIGTNFKESMNFVVGTKHPMFFPESSEAKQMCISSIEETEKHFLIYLRDKEEVYLWKKIPKNDVTTEEYFID